MGRGERTSKPYQGGWPWFWARVWGIPFVLCVAWAEDLWAEGERELVIVPVAVSILVVWRWAVNFARWRRGG